MLTLRLLTGLIKCRLLLRMVGRFRIYHRRKGCYSHTSELKFIEYAIQVTKTLYYVRWLSFGQNCIIMEVLRT